VLPNCPLEEARRLVQEGLARLRERGGPSVSVGLAMVEEGPWAPRDLLAAADEDLYRAKRAAHAGHDQTELRREPRVTRPRRHSSSPTAH
jgi:GGDEF domain-containing protein